MEKEQARAHIETLVTRFENEPNPAQYSEEDVCKNYILPLFAALGWGTNTAEVTAQESIAGKRSDYGFYLGQVPKFYLEAKKPAENDLSKFIRQATNYSYMQGVSWAVLTNFKSLQLYSAEDDNAIRRKRPFRLDIETPRDYLTHFDALWLLSKPSMQAGELDEAGQEAGILRKRKPVIASLYLQLVEWRADLMQDMFKMSSERDARAADNNIQRLFDRLIFMRTIEDRAIEEKVLRQAVNQNKARKGDLWATLRTQFRELDRHYNSNLFAPAPLDALDYVNNDLLARMIDGLYTNREEDFDYNFAQIKEDVLGTVYEQYLGYKSAVSGTEALNTKQRQRKAQGIYYTPQYVVRYIVEETLGAWLRAGGNLEGVRVVDPACGSGSFLIVAFDALDAVYQQRNPHANQKTRTEWRYHILQHNLFGVDLDEQAAEVTRLNLMLRAAYERRTIPTFQHIRVGNSLTTFDWGIMGGAFDVVLGNPPYVRQETLGADFKTYAETAFKTYAGTADLYVYFIEKGYDLLAQGGRMGYIVPNKWTRANYGAALRGFLADKVTQLVDFGDLPVFKDATTYPLIVTLAKGLTDLTLNPSPAGEGLEPPSPTAGRPYSGDGGVPVAIVPKLPALNQPLEGVLGAFHPIPRASLSRAGWSLARRDAQAVLDKLNAVGVPLGEYVGGKIYRGILTGYNEAFVIDRATRDALVRQDARSAELIKPFLAGRDVKRYQQPVSDKFLIFTRRGVNIDEYPAIRAHLETYKDRLMPKPKGHVGAWGGRSSTGHEWYDTQAPIAYWQEFEKPKIVFAEIAQRGQFTLDNNRQCLDTTLYLISSESLYLLGLLNSSVITYALSQTASQIRGGYLRWKNQYVSQLPIPRVDKNNAEQQQHHDAIVALVEKMLLLHARLSEENARLDDTRHATRADIATLDAQIDAHVFALYGLTADEIAVVK